MRNFLKSKFLFRWDEDANRICRLNLEHKEEWMANLCCTRAFSCLSFAKVLDNDKLGVCGGSVC